MTTIIYIDVHLYLKRTKIIVKIDENRLRAHCAETEPSLSSIVYADTKLIYDAVSAAETDIEEVES